MYSVLIWHLYIQYINVQFNNERFIYSKILFKLTDNLKGYEWVWRLCMFYQKLNYFAHCHTTCIKLFVFSLWFPIGIRVTETPETYVFCKDEVLIGLIAVRVMKRPVMSTQFFTVSSHVASDDLLSAMKWQRALMPLSRILSSHYTAVPMQA